MKYIGNRGAGCCQSSECGRDSRKRWQVSRSILWCSFFLFVVSYFIFCPEKSARVCQYLLSWWLIFFSFAVHKYDFLYTQTGFYDNNGRLVNRSKIPAFSCCLLTVRYRSTFLSNQISTLSSWLNTKISHVKKKKEGGPNKKSEIHHVLINKM